jgi:serine/threonine protein kinase
MPGDWDLLIGVLALQLDFITSDDLVTGLNAWMPAKTSPLSDILREQGKLSTVRAGLLDGIAAEHLQQHQGDAHQCLAALPASLTLKEMLRSLGTPILEPVRLGLETTRAEVDPEATGVEPTTEASTTGERGKLRYQILRPHAKGGLGEVFVALDEELHREIALKEIQPHRADVAHDRRRFVLEAEITGGLEHPGIVPVYGLGTYPDGRPYYAMRFIRGDNLKEAVARFHTSEPRTSVSGPGVNRLSAVGGSDAGFRSLLRRFIDVCNAVAYAHSRGVLHRDLKPGNVMLGQFGETLVVDWGLAKATGRAGSRQRPENSGDSLGDSFGELSRGGEPSRGADATPLALDLLRPASGSNFDPTQEGTIVGTPAYMSPEQAAGQLDQLGPATDIYALGATLYTILTNRPPVEGKDLGEMLRKVQAGEVGFNSNADCADSRREEQASSSLRKSAESAFQIPRPLKAITQKAMSLNPQDRYPSALDLARDVEQYLADEPVSAYREPWNLRLRRFARRHRTLVTSAAAVLVVAILGLGVGLIVVGGLNRQLATANSTLGEKNAALEIANAKERAERDRAEVTLRTFVNSLRLPDPDADGKKLTVYELLARIVRDMAANSELPAHAHWSVLNAIGQTYDGLGELADALSVFQKAHEVASRDLGADHPDFLTSQNNLAFALTNVGREVEALPLLEAVLKERTQRYGPDHEETLDSMSNLAATLGNAYRFDESVPLIEECLRLQRATLGPEHPDTVDNMENLAQALQALGRSGEAVTIGEDVLRVRKRSLGLDHSKVLSATANQANRLCSAGSHDEGFVLFEQALNQQKARLGFDHPDTLLTMNNLAMALKKVGKHGEAIQLLEETLSLQRRKLGSRNLVTLATMKNLANCLRESRRFEEALALSQESYLLVRRKYSADHQETLKCLNTLVLVLQSLGRLDEAAPLYQELLDVSRRRLGPEHPDTLIAAFGCGCCRLTLKDYAGAEKPLLECYAAVQAGVPGIHPNIKQGIAPALTDLYESWGKPEEAEKYSRMLPASLQLRRGLHQDNFWPLLWGWPRY